MDTPSLLRNHISLKQLYSIVVPICKHYRIGTCLYTTLTNLNGKYLVMYKVNTDGGIKKFFHVCLALLLDFSLTVKAATVIFISRRSSAISSSKEGKSGFIYNLVKS